MKQFPEAQGGGKEIMLRPAQLEDQGGGYATAAAVPRHVPQHRVDMGLRRIPQSYKQGILGT